MPHRQGAGKPNRAQRRGESSVAGQSKNELLARAQAAEGTANMFKGFYEDQIRANERIVIEAEQLVSQARNEQKATERTIEVILYQEGARDAVYAVPQETLDNFNAEDEGGEWFVHVDQTDDGFDMTLIFEPYEVETRTEASEDTADARTADETE